MRRLRVVHGAGFHALSWIMQAKSMTRPRDARVAPIGASRGQVSEAWREGHDLTDKALLGLL
jgi:hypothetical protein